MYNDINNIRRSQDNKTVIGIILVGIGLMCFSKHFFFFPGWIFSWPMILIVIGLYTGYRHNWRNRSWFLFVVLGLAFLLGSFTSFMLSNVVWPLAFIAMGVYILMRRDGMKC